MNTWAGFNHLPNQQDGTSVTLAQLLPVKRTDMENKKRPISEKVGLNPRKHCVILVSPLSARRWYLFKLNYTFA
jgi:hypothetical protein